MVLPLLVIVLAALTAASYFLFERNVAAPSTLFCGGFLISSAFALSMSGKWGLEMDVRTALVIGGGCLLFFVSTLIVHRACLLRVSSRSKADSGDCVQGNSPSALAVSNKIMIIVCGLYIIALIGVFTQVLAWFPGLDLLSALGQYKESQTFSTAHLSFSFGLDKLVNLLKAAGYLIAYLAAEKIALSNLKGLLLSVLNLVFASMLGYVVGGRFLGLSYCFCFVVALMTLRVRAGARPLSKKLLIAISIFCVIFVLAFQFLSFGRSGSIPFLDYIGIYLGAPISNLNTYLISGDLGGSVPFGRMTFFCVYTYLGYKFGIRDWQYTFDLPFQTLNGYNMGNVYTTYYSFIYDFGPIGVIVLVVLMALIAQLVFERTLRVGRRWNDLWVIMSAFIAFQLFFSFFSDKFYEEIISPGFITTAVYLLAFRYAVCFLKPSEIVARLKVKHAKQK